jgi:hypothetical protein
MWGFDFGPTISILKTFDFLIYKIEAFCFIVKNLDLKRRKKWIQN